MKRELEGLLEQAKRAQSKRKFDRHIFRLVIKKRDLSHIYDEEGSNIPSRDAIADVLEESSPEDVADLIYELVMRLETHDNPTNRSRDSWTWGDYKHKKWHA